MLYKYHAKTNPKVELTPVVCALIFKNNKLLCCQRSKHQKHPLEWEFPGGKIELNETPCQALTRELKEELNIEVNISQTIAEVEDLNKNIMLIALKAELKTEQVITLKEHQQYQWLTLKELQKLNWSAADLKIIDKLI